MYDTQAAGTDAFAAGDVLGLFAVETHTGTEAIIQSLHVWMECCYDTSATVLDTNTTYTAAFTGTAGTVAYGTGAQIGDTAWDQNYMYLKFVATSAALTIAVW